MTTLDISGLLFLAKFIGSETYYIAGGASYIEKNAGTSNLMALGLSMMQGIVLTSKQAQACYGVFTSSNAAIQSNYLASFG